MSLKYDPEELDIEELVPTRRGCIAALVMFAISATVVSAVLYGAWSLGAWIASWL